MVAGRRRSLGPAQAIRSPANGGSAVANQYRHRRSSWARDLPVVDRRLTAPRQFSRCCCSPATTPRGQAPTSGQEKCRRSGAGSRHRARLVAAAAHDDRNVVLVHAHRPVALRRLPRRRARLPAGGGCARRHAHRRRDRTVGATGLDAVLPAVRPQPARHRRRGVTRPAGCAGAARRRGSATRRPADGHRGRRRPAELAPHADPVAGQLARLVGQGQASTSSSTCSGSAPRTCWPRSRRPTSGRTRSAGTTTFPRASSTCSSPRTSV